MSSLPNTNSLSPIIGRIQDAKYVYKDILLPFFPAYPCIVGLRSLFNFVHGIFGTRSRDQVYNYLLFFSPSIKVVSGSCFLSFLVLRHLL